jgi:hypothetical protein
MAAASGSQSPSSLVAGVTDTLQAHERFIIQLKDDKGQGPEKKDCHEKAVAILDQLRELKSRLEGNHFKVPPLLLDPDATTQLKLLVLIHTAFSMTADYRDKLSTQLQECFRGVCKRILYACLMTCPWFAASQSEETARAKHNLLFVVFMADEQHFLSLATPHEKELNEVINEVTFKRLANLAIK